MSGRSLTASSFSSNGLLVATPASQVRSPGSDDGCLAGPWLAVELRRDFPIPEVESEPLNYPENEHGENSGKIA